MSPDQLDFFRLLHNVEAPFAALFAARGTSRSTPTARFRRCPADTHVNGGGPAPSMATWRPTGPAGFAGVGVCVRQVPNPCAGTAPPPLAAAKTLQAARRSYCGLGHTVVCRICSCTRLSLLRSATRSPRASALGCPQRAPLRTCAGSVCGFVSERSVRLRDDGLLGLSRALLCSAQVRTLARLWNRSPQ